jgi:Ca2+-binding EF-hand superfamily protein
MRPTLLIALVLAAAGAGPALAGDARSADRRFDELDRNHDGFLSRAEAESARELQTRFSELDVDNDGKLSRAEYRVVTAGERATLPGARTAASGATGR